MFRDRATIDLLLYRNEREVERDRIEDVWDGGELLKKNVMIDGQAQEYTYGEFETDVFLALTCDGISIHKGIGARRSKTESASCYGKWLSQGCTLNVHSTFGWSAASRHRVYQR